MLFHTLRPNRRHRAPPGLSLLRGTYLSPTSPIRVLAFIVPHISPLPSCFPDAPLRPATSTPHLVQPLLQPWCAPVPVPHPVPPRASRSISAWHVPLARSRLHPTTLQCVLALSILSHAYGCPYACFTPSLRSLLSRLPSAAPQSGSESATAGVLLAMLLALRSYGRVLPLSHAAFSPSSKGTEESGVPSDTERKHIPSRIVCVYSNRVREKVGSVCLCGIRVWAGIAGAEESEVGVVCVERGLYCGERRGRAAPRGT